MQIRLPWLISRQRLVLASAIDVFIFYFVYVIFFYLNFKEWPLLSIEFILIPAIWIIGGYIIGRYYINSQKVNREKLKHFFATFILILVLFLIFITFRINFSYKISPSESIFFEIQIFLAFAAISALIQSSLINLRDTRRKNLKNWLFIGSKEKMNQINCFKEGNQFNLEIISLGIDSLEGQLSNKEFSGLIVDKPYKLSKTELEIILDLQRKGLSVLSILKWSEIELQRIPSNLIFQEDILLGDFYIPKGSPQMRIKRFADFCISTILLILSFPIILIATILIFVEDRGPVFYSQMRMGLDGKQFRIWKLRTMKVNAEVLGVKWAKSSDPRITRIGMFLRKTRIDELPQLLSVIEGSMSLIGPRPERPEFDTVLEKEIPHYKMRYLIRPGLSGWAQVNYPYGASIKDSFNKLSYDIYYFRNFSIFLDLLILLKTIRLVFNAKGSQPKK